jgi:pyruvate dehydrogenase E1 component beta subunit
MVPISLAAAEALAAEGIDAEVVDLRTIVPLDLATVLDSVGRTRRAVVLHSSVRAFGVGAEVSSRIATEHFGTLLAPVERLGAKPSPNPAAANLERAMYPTSDDVVEAARRAMRYQ